MTSRERFDALLERHSDDELDKWQLEFRDSRIPMFESFLKRGNEEDVEWGFMDSERHPLNAEFKDIMYAQMPPDRPCDGLVDPSGSNWQWIAATPHSVGSARPQILDRRQCPVLKHTNSDWDSTLRNLSRVGRPDGAGGEFLRPEGRFIMDLVSRADGDRMLTVAHVLRHMFGGTFVEWVAKVHLMEEFGLPVMSDGKDTFSELGIKVVASIDFRKPTGLVPVFGADALRPFHDELVVFHGVHIEPHPKSYEESDAWLEVNRWSCEPSISVIAGYEYPEFVLKSPIVSRFPGSSRNPLHMVPLPAMLPASALEMSVVSLLRNQLRSKDRQFVFLDEWVSSYEFSRKSFLTPPLPCKECLRLNTMADGHPLRPKGQRPDSLKNAPEDVRKEWEEYERKLDRIFRIVDKASCYALGRIVGHSFAKRDFRTRRAIYNKATALKNSIESAKRRMKSFSSRGYADKAEEMSRRVAMLTRQLENIENGTGGTNERRTRRRKTGRDLQVHQGDLRSHDEPLHEDGVQVQGARARLRPAD